MNVCRTILFAALLAPAAARAVSLAEFLLPNGEPVVGVYYYPWFGGDPYRHVGWTPEFAYDNIRNPDHIREVIRAMTDHGINQASFSYWDNGEYLKRLREHMALAEELRGQGRPCYFSPYLEPKTIDKVFAAPGAQQANADFISTFLRAVGREPTFCRLGDEPFVNMYVTYYRPDETDDDLRAFLKHKYGNWEEARKAWTVLPDYPQQAVRPEQLPDSLEELTLAHARQGTIAFADRQELRARRLEQGWGQVIDTVRRNTGQTTRYTGDVSRTTVSPTDYLRGITGMSWYSFGYALTQPTRRPKLISEIAKYTGGTFLNTISPGYIDRQQRWPGGRVERDPHLYPYAWTKAIQSLPEGIMILTHSGWFEGSVIDVTREYGRREYETTELYASIYKRIFPNLFVEKRRRKAVAVVFNEWATYGLRPGGVGLEGIYGLIKFLECTNIPFDLIPDSMLSAQALERRRLVIVPNCGASLRPGKNELVLQWIRTTPEGVLLVDPGPWWNRTLGADPAGDDIGVRRAGNDGGTVLAYPNSFETGIWRAFQSAFERGKVPVKTVDQLLRTLRKHAPSVFADWKGVPHDSFEIATGPYLGSGGTIVLPAGNAVPWGYIAEHRTIGWGAGKGHSAEHTKPWARLPCTFTVPVRAGETVAAVSVLDSDSARLQDIPFERRPDTVQFDFPLKFHGMFAVQVSPVRLTIPALSLSPGQTKDVTMTVENLTDEEQFCLVSLVPKPGLSMPPVTERLPAGASRDLEVLLSADRDLASGNRSVAFELDVSGRKTTWWQALNVPLPVCIGTRTRVLVGPEGADTTRTLVLTNVGDVAAGGVSAELLNGHADVGGLAPGEERNVSIAFTMPASELDRTIPDANDRVATGRAEVRPLKPTWTARRQRVPLRLRYRQFGREVETTLHIDLIALPGDNVPALREDRLDINPYGDTEALSAAWSEAAAKYGGVKTTTAGGLIIMRNAFLTAVWDPQTGGLESVVNTATGNELGVGPGAMLTAMARTPGSADTYVPVASCRLGEGDNVVICEGETVLPGTRRALRVADRWELAADEPRLRLLRTVEAPRKLRLEAFAPLVLRLNPEVFSQVFPLGVGFEKDGVKRGWLETWYSEGWYLALNGNPARPGEALALLVRPQKGAGETSGLTRFRYGFFPAQELPSVGPVMPDDELQIRMRGRGPSRTDQQARVTIEADIYLLAGQPYAATRALALKNATPDELLENCRVRNGEWNACGGRQTIAPEAPLYMFRVREPLPSVGFFGDRP